MFNETPKVSFIRGRSIVDAEFREKLYSDPSSVAQEYHMSLDQVRQLVTIFPLSEARKLAGYAQEVLQESADYQKAL